MATTQFSKFKTTNVQFELQDPKNWCLLHALLVYIHKYEYAHEFMHLYSFVHANRHIEQVPARTQALYSTSTCTNTRTNIHIQVQYMNECMHE